MRVLIVWFVLSLVASCGTSGETGTQQAHAPVPSEGAAPTVAAESLVHWPTESWPTSTPEEQGMDSKLLAEALMFLHETKDGSHIHSLLVIRHGTLVTEAYFSPFAQGAKHDIASVTKSFMATLIGVAIEEGHILGVEQPVLDLFPDRPVANLDAHKGAMTIRDLLTMRSGLECIDEPTEVTLMQMMGSPDWVQFVLDLPMAAEPGSAFVYCSSNVHLLSAIVQETAGMSALDFAQEHLFGPLGISSVAWPADPQGNNYGWGSLRMTSRDMAKLGYLYLRQGQWDGRQIVTPAWVEAATSPPAGADSDQYGYLWWLKPSQRFYYASGRGGQTIYVLPEQDMVIVLTAGGGHVGSKVRDSFILPAVKSAVPLPPNPDGMARLEAAIQQVSASAPAKPEAVPPLPERAQRVSGQTYDLETNPFGVLSLSLTFEEEQASFGWTLSIDTDENSKVAYEVGLDGVPRVTPGRFGLPAAATGSWDSDNTFVVLLDEIGNIYTWQIKLTFEGDRVTVQMEEVGTGLGSVSFGGRVLR
jgi:CubicO group peptidase (beta-lactamase class C family)